MKKTILHFIYSLGRGGAETMLVKVVKELTDYNNIVVTLFPENYFADELKCDKYYCLNLFSVFQIPFTSHRLKKIIKSFCKKIMGEIVTTAACCVGITLFGLALGFVFLQVQANT